MINVLFLHVQLCLHNISVQQQYSVPSQQNATVFRDMLLFCANVAQKVAVRQNRQVATVYAYFYAEAVLQ